PLRARQHDPGGVAIEQALGRHDGLLQGGGQVLLGVQVGQGADALGELGRVDRHGRCLYFRSPNWRTRSTGQAQRWPGVPIRPNSPTKSCGRSAGSIDMTKETDPPLLPGRAAGNPWVRALVAGLGWGWLLRPLTSLVSWYQAAGRGEAESP